MEKEKLFKIANDQRRGKNILDTETKKEGFGVDMSFGEYALIVCNRSPQAYGPMLEKRIISELGDAVSRVSSKKNRGDLKLRNTDEHMEIKVTCLDSTKKFNIVQVREYQDIKFYIIVIIHPEEQSTSYKYDLLCIPHTDVVAIVKEYGGSAHGTKESVKGNKNKELRVTLNYNKHKHVIDKYRVNDFAQLKKKLMGENYEMPKIQSTIFEYYTLPRRLFE